MVCWALQRSGQQLGLMLLAKPGHLLPIVFSGCMQWGGRLHTAGFGFAPLRLQPHLTGSGAPISPLALQGVGKLGARRGQHIWGARQWGSEIKRLWNRNLLQSMDTIGHGHTSLQWSPVLYKALGTSSTQLTFSTTAGYTLSTRFGALARSLHNQVFAGYGLWSVPWLKGLDLRGAWWSAERWLLVSGVLRNSFCWLPDMVAGSMRPGRWAAVAVVNSINTAGPHLPRVTCVLVAQLIHSARTAQALSRDILYPWKEVQGMEHKPPGHQFLSEGLQKVVFSVYTCWRLFCLLAAFAPLAVTASFALSSERWAEKWCCYLREMLEWCGPAFIKWGQWAATRRDLFPHAVCLELEKLQAQAPAHSFEITRAAVEDTFGFPLEDLFSSFESEAIASGSIGQVHKATIGDLGAVVTGRPAGTTVAVKVRHPNVNLAFERDVALMLMMAHGLCKLPYVKGLKLEETLKQFAGPMREQVDLCIEAANLRCFRHNFRKISTVKFPEPLFPLVAPNILVETFHEGDSVQEVVNGPRSPALDRSLVELGSSTFFDMLLVHNLLHADLHPGNILVEQGPSDGVLPQIVEATSRTLEQLSRGMDPNSIIKKVAKWTADVRSRAFSKEYHIVLLDAGMAAQLTDAERKLMIQLFRAFANKDGSAAAEATLKLAGAAQTCPDAHAFHCDMEEHFRMLNVSETWDGSPFETGVDALAHVLDLVRRHQVVLPGQICSCLFTVFVLEGWSNKLDPMHSVMDQVQDLVRLWDRGLKGLIGNTMEKQWLPGDQRLDVA